MMFLVVATGAAVGWSIDRVTPWILKRVFNTEDLRPAPGYPRVAAMLGAVIAGATCWAYGMSWEMLWGQAAGLMLLALGSIDVRAMLLPDVLVYPLLWTGLLFHAVFQPELLSESVFAVVIWYSLPLATGTLFQWWRGYPGMGHGDFKLMAALAAWLGFDSMPWVVVSAAILMITIWLVMRYHLRCQTNKALTLAPFGAALTFTGWCAIISQPYMTAV